MSTTIQHRPSTSKAVIIHVRRRDRDAWAWDSRTVQIISRRSPLELVRDMNDVEGWPKYAFLSDNQYITN